MLFDKNINTISIIDYEKVEYNNFMWDIADLIRSLLKVDNYDYNIFKNSIKEYEKIKKIPNIEKKELLNYVNSLLIHLSLQYFLALFPESGVENKI
jgi:thiamine kinase-like enzyme